MNAKRQNPDSQRPFVFINMAMTADGKIATASRAVHSFGSARDLAHLYELRATADAILCGARTVEISDATLGNGGEKYGRVRLRRGLAKFPLRVVVSGSGSIDPASRIFEQHFSPIVLLTTRRASQKKLRVLQKLVDEIKICGEAQINFWVALRWLRAKWGVKRLLCEGGGELNDALIRSDLVDEVHLTICPKIFGGRHAPTIADGLGLDRLVDAAKFNLTAFRRQKDELFTAFFRQK